LETLGDYLLAKDMAGKDSPALAKEMAGKDSPHVSSILYLPPFSVQIDDWMTEHTTALSFE